MSMDWENKEMLIDIRNKLDLLLLLFKEADPKKFEKVIADINKEETKEKK